MAKFARLGRVWRAFRLAQVRVFKSHPSCVTRRMDSLEGQGRGRRFAPHAPWRPDRGPHTSGEPRLCGGSVCGTLLESPGRLRDGSSGDRRLETREPAGAPRRAGTAARSTRPARFVGSAAKVSQPEGHAATAETHEAVWRRLVNHGAKWLVEFADRAARVGTGRSCTGGFHETRAPKAAIMGHLGSRRSLDQHASPHSGRPMRSR